MCDIRINPNIQRLRLNIGIPFEALFKLSLGIFVLQKW